VLALTRAGCAVGCLRNFLTTPESLFNSRMRSHPECDGSGLRHAAAECHHSAVGADRRNVTVAIASDSPPSSRRLTSTVILNFEMVRPARFGRATSRFVGVTRQIDRSRRNAMKIRRISELRATGSRASITVNGTGTASSARVTSQSTSHSSTRSAARASPLLRNPAALSATTQPAPLILSRCQ
jgi:hypothetical protein